LGKRAVTFRLGCRPAGTSGGNFSLRTRPTAPVATEAQALHVLDQPPADVGVTDDWWRGFHQATDGLPFRTRSYLPEPADDGAGRDKETFGRLGDREHVASHERENPEALLGCEVSPASGCGPQESGAQDLVLLLALVDHCLELLDTGHEQTRRVGGVSNLGQEEAKTEGEEFARSQKCGERMVVEAPAPDEGADDAVVERGL